MFKVGGKILIYIISFLFFALSFIQISLICIYSKDFSTLNITLGSVEILLNLGLGAYGMFAVRKNLPTWYVLIPGALVFALGIYYFVLIGQQGGNLYYSSLAYINVICVPLLLISCIFNRKA